MKDDKYTIKIKNKESFSLDDILDLVEKRKEEREILKKKEGNKNGK